MKKILISLAALLALGQIGAVIQSQARCIPLRGSERTTAMESIEYNSDPVLDLAVGKNGILTKAIPSLITAIASLPAQIIEGIFNAVTALFK